MIRRTLAQLDVQIPADAPLWAQALGWARLLECGREGALDDVLRFLESKPRQELALQTLIWAGRSLDTDDSERAHAQLLAHGRDSACWSVAVREVTGWSHRRKTPRRITGDVGALLEEGKSIKRSSPVKAVRAWLYRVAEVEDHRPFLERLLVVRQHKSPTLRRAVDRILGTYVKEPSETRTRVAEFLIHRDAEDPLLRAMAVRGEEIAIEAVAEVSTPFLAAWLRADSKGMRAACAGTPSQRRALIHEAHAMQGPSYQACPPQVWADGLMAFVHDADAEVRGVAIDALADLAVHDINFDEALAPAAEMLADGTRTDRSAGGTWRSDSRGFSAARLLGYAFGSARAMKECGQLLGESLSARKKFTREQAGFAVGLGHAWAGRAAELRDALQNHPKCASAIVRGALCPWTSHSRSRKAERDVVLSVITVIRCIRAAGLEPLSFEVLRHRLHKNHALRHVDALPDTPEGFAPLICDLGTEKRGEALSTLLRCARAGISLGPVNVVVAGLLFDGDYRSGRVLQDVYPALSVLAAVSMNEELAFMEPWLADFEHSDEPVIAAAAAVIRVRAVSDIAASDIAEREAAFEERAKGSDFRSARHAADALYSLATRSAHEA